MHFHITITLCSLKTASGRKIYIETHSAPNVSVCHLRLKQDKYNIQIVSKHLVNMARLNLYTTLYEQHTVWLHYENTLMRQTFCAQCVLWRYTLCAVSVKPLSDAQLHLHRCTLELIISNGLHSAGTHAEHAVMAAWAAGDHKGRNGHKANYPVSEYPPYKDLSWNHGGPLRNR